MIRVLRQGGLWIGILVVLAIGSGCANMTTRRVALKEFNTCIPKNRYSSIQGKTVHVAKFTYARNEAVMKTAPAPHEPMGYSYQKFTKEEIKKWDKEQKPLSKGFAKSDANKIGVVRNGYGIPCGGVYVLNDPGEWMKACIEMEVTNQGGRVVPDEKSADVSVSGTITWLAIDMYMKYWSDLIVNVKVTANGKTTEETLHTYGQKTAWSASSFEFYDPIRQCLQQQLHLILQNIEKTSK